MRPRPDPNAPHLRIRSVSILAFDAEREGWAAIPRSLLVDWLGVLARVAQVIAPGYRPPTLPDPIAFTHETIASDGPYGSSENFYYLGYYSIALPGLLIHFESGRHEGGEPLGLETTGLPHNVVSYLPASTNGPALARVFVWHEASEADAVRQALGLA